MNDKNKKFIEQWPINLKRRLLFLGIKIMLAVYVICTVVMFAYTLGNLPEDNMVVAVQSIFIVISMTAVPLGFILGVLLTLLYWRFNNDKYKQLVSGGEVQSFMQFIWKQNSVPFSKSIKYNILFNIIFSFVTAVYAFLLFMSLFIVGSHGAGMPEYMFITSVISYFVMGMVYGIYRMRAYFIGREAGFPVFFKYAYLIIFILTALFFFTVFE